MADQNPHGPQPDFNLLGDEIKKAANLPAITNGQQLLAEMRAMRLEFRQGLADVRHELRHVRQDLVTMISTSNHNNAARVQNTHVKTGTELLTPFLNPTNGTGIDHFPNTAVELGQMTSLQLDRVLQQLGLPPPQGINVRDKRKMLRRHIGLTEAPGA